MEELSLEPNSVSDYLRHSDPTPIPVRPKSALRTTNVRKGVSVRFEDTPTIRNVPKRPQSAPIVPKTAEQTELAVRRARERLQRMLQLKKLQRPNSKIESKDRIQKQKESPPLKSKAKGVMFVESKPPITLKPTTKKKRPISGSTVRNITNNKSNSNLEFLFIKKLQLEPAASEVPKRAASATIWSKRSTQNRVFLKSKSLSDMFEMPERETN